MSRDIVRAAIEVDFPRLVESIERFLRSDPRQDLSVC